MIEVSELTKRYAGHPAVANVSFHVNRGEIVGLLGPNGAGKSTTMRILSGFLPATGGTVRVAGYDVFTQSAPARSQTWQSFTLISLFGMKSFSKITFTFAPRAWASSQTAFTSRST